MRFWFCNGRLNSTRGFVRKSAKTQETHCRLTVEESLEGPHHSQEVLSSKSPLRDLLGLHVHYVWLWVFLQVFLQVLFLPPVFQICEVHRSRLEFWSIGVRVNGCLSTGALRLTGDRCEVCLTYRPKSAVTRMTTSADRKWTDVAPAHFFFSKAKATAVVTIPTCSVRRPFGWHLVYLHSHFFSLSHGVFLLL